MLKAPFISLDGVDGAGKSTQAQLLVDWLRSQGRPALLCQDPGGTEVGAVLRRLVLEHRGHIHLTCEALLFLASRAQLVAEVVRPALEAGTIVVCDRFSLANIVYQGHAGGLDPERIRDIARFATGGLEPNLTFVLDLPMAVAQGRRKARPDRLESRDDAFHDRVLEGFRAEARHRPDSIRLVDATLPPERIHEHIREEIAAYGLERHQGA